MVTRDSIRRAISLALVLLGAVVLYLAKFVSPMQSGALEPSHILRIVGVLIIASASYLTWDMFKK